MKYEKATVLLYAIYLLALAVSALLLYYGNERMKDASSPAMSMGAVALINDSATPGTACTSGTCKATVNYGFGGKQYSSTVMVQGSPDTRWVVGNQIAVYPKRHNPTQISLEPWKSNKMSGELFIVVGIVITLFVIYKMGKAYMKA